MFTVSTFYRVHHYDLCFTPGGRPVYGAACAILPILVGMFILIVEVRIQVPPQNSDMITLHTSILSPVIYESCLTKGHG